MGCTRYMGGLMHLSYIADKNLDGVVSEVKKTKGTEKELADLIHEKWRGKKQESKKEGVDRKATKDEKRGTPD